MAIAAAIAPFIPLLIAKVEIINKVPVPNQVDKFT